MERILYSCMGTTDPVRGFKDGGLVHIMRFYRPDIIYLFLSQEIVRLDNIDHRIDKTLEFVQKNWHGYAPKVICKKTDIHDPSDMDVLLDPMNSVLQQILEEHPNEEILINLSSGTPQMQIILSQMALDSRYPTRGIQVKNPEKKAGTTERTNVKYPVEEALELNEDEEPNAENRCCEPKMIAIHREAIRNQLASLVSQRNYAAIAQMGNDLPQPIPKLAKHLAFRSQFQLEEAIKAASGLADYKLHADKNKLPNVIYEMVEYFGTLKNLVYLKQYTDFVLRLNPFLIRLQMEILTQHLHKQGITLDELLPRSFGRRRINPDFFDQKLPKLKAFLENELGGSILERDPSLKSLNIMLRFFIGDCSSTQLLDTCETLNRKLRNPAAHELFSVTNEQIRTACGLDAETITHRLEDLLIKTLSRYDVRDIMRRLHIYEICDSIIESCL